MTSIQACGLGVEPAQRRPSIGPVNNTLLWDDEEGPLGPIVKDLGSAVAAAFAVYEATLQDAFVMEWTLQQATMELADRLMVIDLG